MPDHIFINRESNHDSIFVFYDEPVFIVVADRSDLPSIQSLDESQKPGIYILLGDNNRYIGQASGVIFNRLQQHNINKPWWNKLIFFGRDDSHLSKAQLDLIEHNVINKMKLFGLNLDNWTQGNTSYIDKLSKSYAISLLTKVESVLKDVANIDIYDVEKGLDDLDDNRDSIKVVMGQAEYTGNSYRQVFIQIVSDVINSDMINDISSIMVNDYPNTIQFIGVHQPRYLLKELN